MEGIDKDKEVTGGNMRGADWESWKVGRGNKETAVQLLRTS